MALTYGYVGLLVKLAGTSQQNGWPTTVSLIAKTTQKCGTSKGSAAWDWNKSILV